MHAIVDAETDATMAFLEEWFARQGGRRGRDQTRTATTGLLWARTRHLTTRAGDPKPHDHVLIANLTEMLDARGGWKALDTGGLRDLVHAATMVGRHASAERAVRLGYAIEADPGPSGKLGHWRLTGIPDEVLDRFSKRSREIDAAMAAEGFDTYRGRGIAARRTRDPKSNRDEPDLWEAWRHELAAAGIDPVALRHSFKFHQRRHRRPLRALTERDLGCGAHPTILSPTAPTARCPSSPRRQTMTSEPPHRDCERVRRPRRCAKARANGRACAVPGSTTC